MSAVLALFNRSRMEGNFTPLQRALDATPERGRDGSQLWQNDRVALAHQHFWITTEEQGEQQPLHERDSNLTISADARLDNRDELFRLLGLKRDRAISDAALIMLAYRNWAERCVEYLRGDFAFVIWDGRHNRLYAARDVLGNRDLAYYADENICLITVLMGPPRHSGPR